MSLLLNTTLHDPTKPELFKILFIVENGRICNKLPMEAIVVLDVFLFLSPDWLACNGECDRPSLWFGKYNTAQYN